MGFAKNGKINLSHILFCVFWWITHLFSLQFSKKLITMGVRDGAFPKKRIFDGILKVKLWGQTFHNPIGVAAGLDKRGNVIDELIAMGYAFGEFGSYTLEQERPIKQVYYLRKDKAILVQSLGYPNPGINKIVPMLMNRRYLPNFIGVNIVSSAPSESENVKLGRVMSYNEEFAMMTEKIAPYCDYITLNLSHPESELSRIVSDRATIVPLVHRVQQAIKVAAPLQPPKLFLKLPVDLTPVETKLVCDILQETKIDGVIIGGVQSLSKNSRKLLQDKKYHHIGMLSGKPIKDISTELVRRVYQHTQGKIPIIACGGVFTGADAFEKIAAGASLIQIYSSIIFNGPNVVNKINRELAAILRQKGFLSVEQAVGADFN